MAKIFATVIVLFVSQLSFANLSEKRILFVSDSHGLGAFGQTFLEAWSNQDLKFDFFAISGSAPIHWVRGGFKSKWGFEVHSEDVFSKITASEVVSPSFSCLLKNQSEVWISLGTNFSRTIESQASDFIWTKRLMNLAFQNQAKNCYWIGPPDLREDKISAKTLESFYTVLNEAARQVQMEMGRTCQIVDSRKVSKYPEKEIAPKLDGIHYQGPIGTAEAKKWAQGILSLIQSRY